MTHGGFLRLHRSWQAFDIPVDAMVSIDTFVQLFRLASFCVIASVQHA